MRKNGLIVSIALCAGLLFSTVASAQGYYCEGAAASARASCGQGFSMAANCGQAANYNCGQAVSSFSADCDQSASSYSMPFSCGNAVSSFAYGGSFPSWSPAPMQLYYDQSFMGPLQAPMCGASSFSASPYVERLGFFGRVQARRAMRQAASSAMNSAFCN